MKYKIFRTNSFKSDFKKLNNSEKEIFEEVVTKLANGDNLEEKYKDHSLKGSWNGCRECHLKPDLLLIYKINNDILELALLKVGSHATIFKK